MKKTSLKLKIHSPKLNTEHLLGWGTLLIVLIFSALLLQLVYTQLIQTVLFPKELDPSQVTARQEKVNRQLLEQILQKDQEKRATEPLSITRDPFLPL